MNIRVFKWEMNINIGIIRMALLGFIFFKTCTKGYVVNSSLAPPLNPDSQAVSHVAACST